MEKTVTGAINELNLYNKYSPNLQISDMNRYIRKVYNSKLINLDIGKNVAETLEDNSFYFYTIYGKPSTTYWYIVIFGLDDIVWYIFTHNAGQTWSLKDM